MNSILGNTPLNEALIYLTDLIPQFKKKYGIGKMTLITLTDGGVIYECLIHNLVLKKRIIMKKNLV